MSATLAPGFADPVAQSQAVFRALLDAMAQPGRIAALADGTPAATPLSPAAAAVALTLADFETPVWLAPALTEGFAWLRFHSGCRRAASPGEARFAFATSSDDLPPLLSFDLGSDEFPDRSTTLIVEVPALDSGPGLSLSGPGIKSMAQLRVGGLDAAFWRARAEMNELFPRGLDLVLTCGNLVAALPRTTRVEA